MKASMSDRDAQTVVQGIGEGFVFHDVLKASLERGVEVDGIERVRAGLDNPASFTSGFHELLVVADYARRGYKVNCLPNPVAGSTRIHDLSVIAGGVEVPVEVTGINPELSSRRRLVDDMPDYYRALRDCVSSAYDQLPRDCGGVIHIFLPPEDACDLFAAVEHSYEYLQRNLIDHIPCLNALVVESLQLCPWTGESLQHRYLLPNHLAEYSLPAELSLAPGQTELPEWRPRGAEFFVKFSCMLPLYPQQAAGRLAQLVSLASPHGTLQIRSYVMASHDIRIDLVVSGLGRVVVLLKRDGLSPSVGHHFDMKFNTEKRSLRVVCDGWELGAEQCEIRWGGWDDGVRSRI
jgi:hypothetical protein